MVMSFATGLWMRDTALRLQQQGMDLNRKSLGGIGKSEGVYTNTRDLKGTGWKWENGDKDDSDLTWLL